MKQTMTLLKHIVIAFTSFLTVFFTTVSMSPAMAETATIPVLTIKDAIHLGTAQSIERMIREASAKGQPAVIIELDTPGGFLEATRDIVQLFLNTDDVKIIVWVTPQGARAASAGAMITLAAHYAAMSSSTSIGAATPVAGGGQEIPKDMKAKIENDTVSFVRGIAEKRGRNLEWAEKSVTEAASVDSKEGVKLNIIDGVHDSREDLWAGASKKLDLPSTVQFETFELQLKEKFLSFISNPNIAMGLMALGALGIYVEMTNPGLIIPGTIGVISLALGAITMKIIPIRPGAMILLIIGVVFLALEVLTSLPTFGVAGAAGLASIFMSGLFLLDPQQTNLGLDASFWLPMFFLLSAFVVWLGLESIKSLKINYKQGFGAFVGLDGVVTHILGRNQYKIKIQGETWNAQSEQELQKNDEVTVFDQDNLTLEVKKKV